MVNAENEDSLLILFDLYWFHHEILHQDPPAPPPPPLPSPPKSPLVEEAASEAITSPHPRSGLWRSSSDGVSLTLVTSPDPSSPPPPKLQTILSGKEAPSFDQIISTEEETKENIARVWKRPSEEEMRRRRRRRKRNKSLSELEFEELSGMMDLGFNFTETEADPRLLTIVPALRRRATAGEADEAAAADRQEEEITEMRPYLSEAWDVDEEYLLKNWRIPTVAAGANMKDHLMFWAHLVAHSAR